MRLSAFFRSWDPRRRPQEAKKTAKKRPEGAKKPQKRDPKTNLKKERFWNHFWANFGAHFGLQNSSKSAPKMGPENDAKKSRNPDPGRGPVLLPSVAAQRQHLKPQLKLAFGTRPLNGHLKAFSKLFNRPLKGLENALKGPLKAVKMPQKAF